MKLTLSKEREITLKVFSICFGFAFSFFIFEIFARIAPARSAFPLEKPIRCDYQKKITINCLHRRKPYSKGTWSAGKFRPFNQFAFKKTNDIGQFSDIDFKDFVENKDNKIQVLTIGDSYAEALQVKNSSSFHGILNNQKTKKKEEIISTSIAASGMALPNYIASMNYARTLTDLNDKIIIIPIISNDFDESFVDYAAKGRRRGLGQFFFNKTTEKMDFVELPKRQNLTQKSIDFLLKKSALTRYLVYNLQLTDYLSANLKFLTRQKETEKKYIANIVESKKKETPERFELSVLAIDIFINKLKNIRNNSFARERTFLVIDADRNSIYNKSTIENDSFYQTMRKEIIKKATLSGFKVIDMEPVFNKDYAKNNLKFNSPYDGHWNAYGHKKVNVKILEMINML